MCKFVCKTAGHKRAAGIYFLTKPHDKDFGQAGSFH